MSFSYFIKQFLSILVVFFLLCSQTLLAAENIPHPAPTTPSTPPTPPIVIDPSVVSNNPTLDKSRNNIDIINIATPNNAGISNNYFKEFNVPESGVIFNNSKNLITSSKLAGLINGNIHLKDKEASLILNQVTGNNISELLGMMEIAGKTADLIIANPNGITCNGCGFINSSSSTLTTGSVSLEELHRLNELRDLSNHLNIMVQRGHINIEALNASNIPTLNLIAKNLSINKNLLANKLNIILGTNKVGVDISKNASILLYEPIEIPNDINENNSNDINQNKEDNQDGATSKTKTALALDVAYLGSALSGSIYLVATEKGIGVKNSGRIATLASEKEGDGGFVIDVNGKVEIAKPKENNTIDTPDDDFIPPSIASSSDLHIRAKEVENHSILSAKGDLEIKAENVSNIGSLELEKVEVGREYHNSWCEQEGRPDGECGSDDRHTTYEYNKIITEDHLKANTYSPAIITAKNIHIKATTLSNDTAILQADDKLELEATHIVNTEPTPKRIEKKVGTTREYDRVGGKCGVLGWLIGAKNNCHSKWYDPVPFTPAPTISSISLSLPSIDISSILSETQAINEQIYTSTPIGYTLETDPLYTDKDNFISTDSFKSFLHNEFVITHPLADIRGIIDGINKNTQSFVDIELSRASHPPLALIESNQPSPSSSSPLASSDEATSESTEQSSESTSTDTNLSPYQKAQIKALGLYGKDISLISTDTKNSSTIKGDHIAIDAKFLLSQNGKIIANDKLAIHSETFKNQGAKISGKDISVSANSISISSIIDKSTNTTQNPSKASFISANSAIKGKNISLQAKDNISITASSLKAQENLSIIGNHIDIGTQRISNSYKSSSENQSNNQSYESFEDIGSTLSANNLNLKAQNALDITNSKLLAKEDISLTSLKEMHFYSGKKHLKKESHYEKQEDYFFVQKNIQTDTQATRDTSLTNSFRAKNISINANNLISKGSSYEAEKNLNIDVQNNYTESVAENASSEKNFTSTSYGALEFIPVLDKQNQDTKTSQTYNHSNFKAKNISIHAGNNLTLLGTDSVSDANTHISSGKDMLISSVKDVFSHSSNSTKSVLGGFYKKQTQDNITDAKVVKNQLYSNEDLGISASGDILLKSTEMNANKNINISGDQNILIKNDSDTHLENHSIKTKGFKGFVFDINKSGLDVGVSFSKKESSSKEISKKVISSDISAKNIFISSGKDISLTGSNLNAKEDIALNAKGNVNISNAQDEYSFESNTKESELQVTAHIGNAYVDVATASYGLEQSTEKLQNAIKNLKKIESLYKENKASKQALDDAKANVAFASVNIANSALALNTSIAGAASAPFYGTGFYGSINTTLIGKEDSQEMSRTISRNSQILANKNISINAGESISQVGSQTISTDGDVSYRATKDISILASQNTATGKSRHRSISSTTSFGTNGIGENIGGEMQNSSFSETSMVHSKILAQNGAISLSTGETTSLKGANISAQDINIDTKDFNLISLQDTSYSNHNGFSASVGGGGSIQKNQSSGYASVGFGLQKGYDKHSFTQTQSSVIGDNVSVNAKGDTFIQGAILASGEFVFDKNDEVRFVANKNLSMKTQHLTLKDMQDFSQTQDRGIGLSVNPSFQKNSNGKGFDIGGNSQINANNYGDNAHQEIYTVLTQGEIQVQDSAINTPPSLSHSDVNTSKSVLKSELTNALDISMEIDHRLLNKQGLLNIAQDFKELPKNIVQIGKGLKNNLISQSVKNSITDKDTSLKEAFKNYIKDDHLIAEIQNDMELSNALNGLTNLDAQGAQEVLQNTSDIAAKEGGFGGILSIYNNDSSTKGYAYEGTINNADVKLIGFNTLSNDLTQSKEVINTLFHETTNKALHHNNEQTAINRGNTAGNIWELKNYRHQNNNTLSTKEWNGLYSDKNSSYRSQAILAEGNMLNSQSKNNNGVYGDRNERTIFVHGTFSDPEGAFSQEFREATAKALNDPHQEDFIWSGENNKPARSEAAKKLLKQIQKPYEYQEGESLNIVSHSHGGNVVKEMSHYYDYTQDKIPVVINIATPNREDYTMDSHIKEYYNVYNKFDTLVQGWAGGTDMPDTKDLIQSMTPLFFGAQVYRLGTYLVLNKKIEKFEYTTPHQVAKEPNAVNIEIEKGFAWWPFTTHTNFKTAETMQILQKEMKKRRNND